MPFSCKTPKHKPITGGAKATALQTTLSISEAKKPLVPRTSSSQHVCVKAVFNVSHSNRKGVQGGQWPTVFAVSSLTFYLAEVCSTLAKETACLGCTVMRQVDLTGSGPCPLWLQQQEYFQIEDVPMRCVRVIPLYRSCHDTVPVGRTAEEESRAGKHLTQGLQTSRLTMLLTESMRSFRHLSDKCSLNCQVLPKPSACRYR